MTYAVARAARPGLTRARPARPLGARYTGPVPASVGGFSEDARKAIAENPDYFVWWYTVKSVGLGIAAAYAAYLLGRDHGRRSRP